MSQTWSWIGWIWLVGVVCLMASLSRAQGVFRTARIDKLGQPISFNCTTGDQPIGVIHWLLPELIIIEGGERVGVRHLRNNDFSLVIDSVEQEHLGDYLCYADHGTPVGKTYTKVTVYLYRPTFWENYQRNFTIGLSAAAVALVIFTGLCLLCNMRFPCRIGTKYGINDRVEERGAYPGFSADGASGQTYMYDSHPVKMPGATGLYVANTKM